VTKVDTAVVITDVIARVGSMVVFGATDENGDRRRYVSRSADRPPSPGESWHVTGEREWHPEFGWQIAVRTMRLTVATGRLIRHVLAGQSFPGIGEATANRLWNEIGPDLVRVLDERDVGHLVRVLGDHEKGRGLAMIIVERWPEVSSEPGLLAWADRHDISSALIGKLIRCYGGETRSLIEADPYRLLAFDNWTGVERVATSLGVAKTDLRRTVAACEAALYSMLDAGHTWIDDVTLRITIAKLISPAMVDAAITTATEEGAIVACGGGWQAAGPHAMERDAAERLALMTGSVDLRRALDVPAFLIEWEATADVTLNVGQRQAVSLALSQRLSLVTGGAGVGKTTVLRAICDGAARAGLQIELMALSGRAALRICEATDREARTITGWLALAEAGKIELRLPTLIVIDESSMVDLASFYRILRTLTSECRLLVVGDPGQLPPVGFGLTLHLLEQHHAIPRTHLIEVMRQAAQTGIPAASAAVRAGVTPSWKSFTPDDVDGVSIERCKTRNVAAAAVRIRRSLPRAQVIGSIRGRGAPDGGTIGINRALHDAYVEAHDHPDDEFVPGEPVIWTVNDYALELWNGSLGRVVGYRTDAEIGLVLDVSFDEGGRSIPVSMLHHMEHAWAITTHKAQGSSFDTVIVPVVPSQIMDRTLLYTAITRARRRVILVGDPTVVDQIISSPSQASVRGTWLAQALDVAWSARASKAA
jgi:exodeoxyribonuclease V alpha subunit